MDEMKLGRWLSPDPLGGDITNPQSLNRYAYVLNSPTTFIDPLGLSGCYQYYCGPAVQYPGYCAPEFSQCYSLPGGGYVGVIGVTGYMYMPSSPGDDSGAFNWIGDATITFVGQNGINVGEPGGGSAQQKYEKCMEDYSNSAMGKEGAFWDPFRNLRETMGLVAAKLGGLLGANSVFKLFPAVEASSVVVPNQVQTVANAGETATSGLKTGLEIGAPYLEGVAALSTASDLIAAGTCSSIAYGLPLPIPGT